MEVQRSSSRSILIGAIIVVVIVTVIAIIVINSIALFLFGLVRGHFLIIKFLFIVRHGFVLLFFGLIQAPKHLAKFPAKVSKTQFRMFRLEFGTHFGGEEQKGRLWFLGCIGIFLGLFLFRLVIWGLVSNLSCRSRSAPCRILPFARTWSGL